MKTLGVLQFLVSSGPMRLGCKGYILPRSGVERGSAARRSALKSPGVSMSGLTRIMRKGCRGYILTRSKVQRAIQELKEGTEISRGLTMSSLIKTHSKGCIHRSRVKRRTRNQKRVQEISWGHSFQLTRTHDNGVQELHYIPVWGQGKSGSQRRAQNFPGVSRFPSCSLQILGT